MGDNGHPAVTIRTGIRLILKSTLIDDDLAVANFDRSVTVGRSVFSKVFPQWPGTIFPVEYVPWYRLVVDGDTAQPRIFQCLWAVALNLDVAI